MSTILEKISKAQTPKEKKFIVDKYLISEGIELPSKIENVDYSENGKRIKFHNHRFTIQYSTVNKFGEKIYYFVEREIEHIIPRLLDKGKEYIIESIPDIPRILNKPDDILIDVTEAGTEVYIKKVFIPRIKKEIKLVLVVRMTKRGWGFVVTLYDTNDDFEIITVPQIHSSSIYSQDKKLFVKEMRKR